ncbi:hypothetical protein LEMLEM_LOCUS25473, partial [Lemmus lemmus]
GRERRSGFLSWCFWFGKEDEAAPQIFFLLDLQRLEELLAYSRTPRRLESMDLSGKPKFLATLSPGLDGHRLRNGKIMLDWSRPWPSCLCTA